jgi:GMP synthase (glutamine-hydrolysing)
MITTLKRADEAALAAIQEEKTLRKTNEVFLVFPLGSQFDHLIMINLSKLGVFALIADPRSVRAEDVRKIAPTGIILSGGPASVYDGDNPVEFDKSIFDTGIPVLGICLGFQLWAQHVGATVKAGAKREFGTYPLSIINESKLFEGIRNNSKVLQSHGDVIEWDICLHVFGVTENAPVAAASNGRLYGVQFHPETSDTADGMQIFRNFCFKICGAKDSFPADDVALKKTEKIRSEVGDKKVIIALSGGSDSSVVAGLLKQAFADTSGRFRAIYIKGIDRPDDEACVKKYFGNEPWLELVVVDATALFLDALKGKTGMHEKRVAMRGVYKKVLEDHIVEFGASFIAQGTLYTDLAESGFGHDGGKKAQIKLHHNTGLQFSVPELMPLEDCVKDSARAIGRSIGVPEELLVRHPFPGPGLVVRIEGEITAERLAIARHIDGIYIEELRAWNLYGTVWQAGAVVTKSETTCTKGDGNATGYVIALWAVWSVNGFTAQWAELQYAFLGHVSRRITNEVREAGAVVYRVSSKPPTTIEWG